MKAMLREQERTSKLEQLTDAEVYTTIRYLESDSEHIDEQPDPIAFVLELALVIQLLGCIATVWFYQWTH
jgi:hypothetical protein